MKSSVPTTRPPHGEGWTTWENPYRIPRSEPYDFVEVEIWRRGWIETKIMVVDGFDPMFNVSGLWWKPTRCGVAA